MELNLDEIVDYKGEYSSKIEHARISGGQLTGLCPFHNDRNNSFSADLKTGQWKCFAEDRGGNFLTFWAEYHKTDTREAYRQILDRYHVTPPGRDPRRKRSDLQPYSVEQYAREKRLPVEFLAGQCGLTTETDRSGTTYLAIPYFRETGEPGPARKRYGGKRFFWQRGSAGKICLYGEWRLPEYRGADDPWVALVEGESDTQTMWFLGFPAIGVAGASMFRDFQTMALQGMKLYIHQEPDTGGETFRVKLCNALKATGFRAPVYAWSCKSLGCKDPSETFLRYGEEQAARLIREAMAHAEPLDLAEETEIPGGAPISLRIPDGWTCTAKGVSCMDPKTGAPALVCRTPLLLTQRLRSLTTGEEKIEIAFQRDGAWQTAVFPRSVIFNARSISTLSDLGCTITSENAKGVVRYLGALEAENIDTIPLHEAAQSFGWQPGRRFIPGHYDGITLDIDPSQKRMAAAYCQAGTMQGWIDAMRPHREGNIFRFILAAGFAAPLLRIVRQRIFFVYNWGGSRGGKTAALKAALSIWGEPDGLMANFNTTQVGMERTAAFYCDLPLGIDERQLAGNAQGSLDRLVYMISAGMGRIRGAKTGGLQTVQQWRTVAIATGEEPLGGETSQTGVSTRVLEIYGAPFRNEADAGLMHQQAAADYGWAGPAFIERLIATPESEIVERYDTMHDYVRGVSCGHNGAHVAGVALVALADALAGEWIFGDTREAAEQRAQTMAADILRGQVETNETDVNENAVQHVTDWMLSHKAYFEGGGQSGQSGQNGRGAPGGESWGFVGEDGNTYYIYPSILKEDLARRGFSARKTIRYMAEKGVIGTETGGNGTTRYSVLKWHDGHPARFIEFRLPQEDTGWDNGLAETDEDVPEEFLQDGTGGLPLPY